MGRIVDGGGHPAIAIVGAGCRLPGGINDLDTLWAALEEGRDLVGRVPDDRFEAARFVDEAMPRVGRSYTAAGAFLDDISLFDADYFGISPKEAEQMDPQHRLLLEMTAEAVDDAAIDPARLAGTDTGVFVGISDVSYGGLQMMSPQAIGPYAAPGATHSIAANRLSHVFDLRGPSMAVDTACSSSLIALERACRQVASDGGVALAGGVNVLLSPAVYIAFSQAAMLSPKGRCAVFSAEADGFVRAEGGGMVVLKRLEDAVADGDRIHGVLVGWGSNSDGRTAGLALPNPDAQEDLLRTVYERAGVDPDELVYMEAHGTGTLVGDPFECRALGRALGRRRSCPLPVGSIKSNMGHLEPASGMAGLFKTLLVLRRGRIPASLHASPLNPDIDFDGLGLAPAVEPCAVEPLAAERRTAGVNSFGFGGANAHLIVAAPAETPSDSPTDEQAGAPSAHDREETTGAPDSTGDSAADPDSATALPIVVSARSPKALAVAAERMADRVATADSGEFYDVAYTSCVRRGKHPYRLAVLAGSGDEAAGKLRAAESATSTPAADDGRTAFVYSGNGSQWAGMGADLLAVDPVFAEAVAEADAELGRYLGWSVSEVMARPRDEWGLGRTEVAQPMLFAVQVGLTRALEAWGIRPAAVIGHSVGEVAAAWGAGMLSLRQAAWVVAARSEAQAPTAGSGRMLAVSLSAQESETLVERFPGVEIAGVNSDRDVTLAGTGAQITALTEELEQRGVFVQRLDLDYAFHSPAMDPIREPLLRALDGLAPTSGRIPLASTVTGDLIEGAELTPEYWWHGVRDAVLFAAAADRLRDSGIGVFAEVGPHPILCAYLRRVTAGSPHRRYTVTATLRRDTGAVQSMDAAVTPLIAAGADIDWRSTFFRRPGRAVDLPSYPWQRERHWNGTPHHWAGLPGSPLDHPLLGARLPTAIPTWEGPVEPAIVPWIADHKITGSVIFPGAGYIEMALSAGRRALDHPVEAYNWEFTQPLVIPWAEATRVRLRTSLSPNDGAMRIASSEKHDGRPRQHAHGRVRRLLGQAPPPLDVTAIRVRCERHVSGAEHYERVAQEGFLQYGHRFQVLQDLWGGSAEVIAAYHHDADEQGMEVHPALFDGALQAVAPLIEQTARDEPFLVASIGTARVWRTPADRGWVRVRDRTRIQGEMCCDISVTDEQGAVTVELSGVRVRRVTGQRKRPVAVQHTVVRAAPHPDQPADVSPLPEPELLAARAARRMDDVRDTWPGGEYARFVERVSPIIARFGIQTLLAVAPRAREGITWEEARTGLPNASFRMLETLASSPDAHDFVESLPCGEVRVIPSEADEPHAVYELVHDQPSYANILVFLLHQLRHFPEIASGERDPLELLADESTGEIVRQLFATSPPNRFCYQLAQALIEQIVAAWPTDRPLRVVEVGAGTGGFTQAVLPLLPPERTRYTFTDVSPFFFAAAQKNLAAYDFVDYQVLDLDTDPAEQGFTPGGYDLVLAANALHTARDMGAAMPRVASLLAEGGQLLAVEFHNRFLLTGLFGTLESHWDAVDTELRPHGKALARDQWPDLLRCSGFQNIVQTGSPEEPGYSDFSVLLAATGAEAPPPPVGAASLHAGDAALTDDSAATGSDAVSNPPCQLIAVEAEAELPLANAVAAAAEAAGSKTQAVVAPDESGAWADLLAEQEETVSITLLLAERDETGPDSVSRTVQRAKLVRSIVAARGDQSETMVRSLVVVTRPSGAMPAPEKPEAPLDAAMWGMARTLDNELSDVRITRISLERSGDTDVDARRLVTELLGETAEDEIVLTRGGRFVPREIEHVPEVPSAEVDAFALDVREPGLSYHLQWVETDRPEPVPGSVCIEVRAAALNYRDVMQAIGLLPAEAVEGTLTEQGQGLECAGVVTAVGAGAEGLEVGDRVFALAPNSLASHTITAAHAVSRIPDHMTFAEAATAPVVFTTVQYALGDLARLASGETVLVHGGTGGVGLAALQYARERGARVIVTAGSEIKRGLLKSMGVDDVLHSRDLDFVPKVMELTGGQGVDVVLNSLAGEAIARGLELLKPSGRFIELGKRDIMMDGSLPLKPFHRNLTFCGVDLNALLDRPDYARGVWSHVTQRIHDGRYRPLPYTAYPAARVREAFTLLQHSRHIGKVIVTFDEPGEPVSVRRRTVVAPQLDAEGTYLVTGGLGGFGAATARHLAERGARHLALVSRRGAEAPEASDLLAELAEGGVQATAYAADCSDADAMADVLRRIDADGYQLRGVVHAAMELDDDEFIDLTGDRIASVLRPKMGGLQALDSLTRRCDLDLFCTYSSQSANIGNVLQANYAAANLYTEALIRRRRSRHLPGLAVAWGHIGDVGYVARQGLSSVAEGLGAEAVTSTRAMGVLDGLIQGFRDADVAVVHRTDWGMARRNLPSLLSPRFGMLLDGDVNLTGADRQDIIAELSKLPTDEARAVIMDHLTELLADVMHIDPDRLDPDRRLDEYGLDSLMAAELLTTMRQQYAFDIPPLELLRSGGTISGLTQTIMLRLGLGVSTGSATTAASEADTPPESEAETVGDADSEADTGRGPEADTEPGTEQALAAEAG
ncbi:type I polyketide synthase [Nocardiopsis gilva YIM 90087]|uniref:Type I polyketide synthase n=1 Tax=Nocardiopsis gilva YIM 90087 TaxID=1235441 RepID=A0A223SAQ5_9ACTN|nr:type I polyketide synthase [Nocardiopsis gilva]ASU85227.1 type I polyketide synthase [Nocardiopsis gilva YIM 90087]